MAITTMSLTIPAGSALSGPLAISTGLGAVRIGCPSGWDAAPLSFQISYDSVNYLDLFHLVQTSEGGWFPYEANVALVPPGGILLLPPGVGANVSGLKLRSGTRTMPISQSADRVFSVVFGP